MPMLTLLLACAPPVFEDSSSLEDERIDLSNLPRNVVDDTEYGFVLDVYFTEPGITPDPEADSLMDDAAIALIGAATTRIDLSLYEFNEPPLVDAVLAAIDRGVEVRMVGDGDEVHDEGYVALEEAGVHISMRNPKDRIMHDKYMIVDDQVVWTGSTNFSKNGLHRNNNNSVVIESTELAQHYLYDFEQMYADGLFGRKKEDTNLNNIIDFRGHDLDFYFSPQHNPIEVLVDEVDRAERSVRFLVFSYTHPDLRDAMLRAQARGVEVYGVFDVSQGRGRYSVDEDLAGGGVPSWLDGNENASGFSGGKLHHKMMLIDAEDAEKGRVVTGSFNWSKSATLYNDENLVILRERGIVQLYRDEFCRQVEVATLHPSYTGSVPDPCVFPSAEVFLNELLPDPDGTDRGNEFVELVNGSKSSVDLTGWTLSDATRTRHTFEGLVLAPGETFVLYDSGEHEHTSSTGYLSLNNTGDTIQLRNGEGELIDELEYGDAEPGVSWNRSPDMDVAGSWVLHTQVPDAVGDSSPGERADGTEPDEPPPVRVILNELLPNPTGTDTGQEYVEILNVGEGEADLSGWTLGDLADPLRHEFTDTVLLPGEALVLFDTGDHSGIEGWDTSSTGRLSLNNSGDVITLVDDEGEVHDQVSYTRSSEGVSLNRASDGSAGAELIDHDEISSLDQSPGTRADGSPWLE